MRQKNKRNAIIAWIVAIVLVTAAIILGILNSRFRYNEDGATGNTTGNLYNGGTFCEYKNYVYFANPADDNSLYRMKSDGTGIEKLHTDSASYIQVVNDYIYYIRLNRTSADVVLKGNPYGIYRLEIGDDTAESVYNGLVKSMCLCGNYIYFQAYDDENLIQLKRVKIDGEELKTLTDKDYEPLAVWGTDIYFPEVEDGYNLKRIEVGTDNIETAQDGNFYMPAFIEGYMYYIDLDNDMKLTRISLSTNEKEILDEGRCINYNLSQENNVVYYQLENEDDHKLCRMQLDGDGKVTIAEGDCSGIHITENYTYYYKITGADVADKTLYRVLTNGDTIQEVNFEKAD